MTYRVYCDGLPIYHSRLENLQIFNASVELELNKTGSFEFTVYPDHPRYGLIKRLKPIITVFQDDHLLFRGRVLDEETGFHNEKKLGCEGDFAFLLDSVLRPFAFTGTPAEFLAYVLTLHNAQVEESKRFALGNVTVDGLVPYDTQEYLPTKETLEKALVEPLGGYLMTRFESGQAYLDYLADITLLAPQTIEFGKNLIDLKRIGKNSDVATVVIPLGTKLKDEEGNDTGKRLTIEAVNGGADFVQSDSAISQFGTIVKQVIFEDVTDAETLKQLGQAHLSQSVKLPDTIELTAVDLSAAGYDIASFHLGTMVRVVSKPHGISQLFQVVKLSIDLHDPASNKLTLGGFVEGFSTGMAGLSAQQGVILQTIERNATQAAEAVYNVEQNVQSSIQVASDNIMSSVSESYYLKDDTDALISSVSTEITQTKNSFDIQFTQFRQDIDSVVAGTDAEFEEIKKYIRFVDGMILLGEVGNELELQIANDRISFLQDGAEVAYFSNRKLYVTDTQILHSLQLGNFAFMPRSNGNLSFKRIT